MIRADDIRPASASKPSCARHYLLESDYLSRHEKRVLRIALRARPDDQALVAALGFAHKLAEERRMRDVARTRRR